MPNTPVSINKPTTTTTVPLNTPKTITGLSISDVDAGAADEIYTVSLMPVHGTLSLVLEDGIQYYPDPIIGTVDMSDLGGEIFSAPPPGSLFIGGTFAAINAALATLLFTPEPGYNGPGGLTMMVSDHATGSDLRTSDYEAIALSIGGNQAPEIADLGGDTVAYVEESLPVFIDLDSDALITDDNANFDGGSLTIAIVNRDFAEDVLLFDENVVSFNENDNGLYDVIVDGVVIGEMPLEYATPFDDLALTFNSEATAARVTMLLHAVTYNNLDFVDPTEGTRTVRFSLTDGGGFDAQTTTVDSFIAVTDTPEINREPVFDLDSGSPGVDVARSYTEGAAAIALAPLATSDDPDLLTYNGGSLTIAVDSADSGDQLTLVSGGGVTIVAPNAIDVGGSGIVATYTGGSNGNPLVITFLPVGSVATTPEHVVDDIVKAIRYRSTADAPAATRTITFTLNDGGGTEFGGDDTAVATATVTIASVNDAPVATASGAAYAATEQVVLDIKNSGLLVADGDAGSGSVTVTLGVDFGVLDLAAGGSGVGITGSGSSSVTLTGTLAAINDLLNGDATSSVSYTADSDTPPASATLTLAISDNGNTGSGGALSDDATKTITITPANDAPTVTLDTTFAPAGGEIRVNTTTTSDQSVPSVAALAGGGYVVTWQSDGQDGDADGVYQQRYDATGNPLGGETLVNTTTADSQWAPSVAALAGGGHVVTWQSYQQDGSGFGVYQQRYDVAGNPLGGETRVNTTTADSQWAPSVAALAGGGHVVTWHSFGQDGSLYGVYQQLYDVAGNPLGGETRVNTYTTSDQSVPSVAALAGGGYVVTWQSDGQDGAGGGVYQQRYDVAGNPLGGETRVNTTTASGQYSPSVAALAGGGHVVTWTTLGQDGSGSGIYQQRYDVAGNPAGGETRVNTYTASDQSVPSVRALAGGGHVVTWTSNGQDGSGTGVYQQRYDVAGNPVGGETRVNTYTLQFQETPSVAALAGGGHVVTWASYLQDGSAYGVYLQRYVDGATEQVPLDLKGTIGVADADGPAEAITVTLSVDFGMLGVAPGTSGAIVTGSGTASVTIAGTLAQVQALLGSNPTSAVTYTANSDAPPASATLEVTVDDGDDQATASHAIAIFAVDDAAVANDDLTATVAEDDLVNIAVLANDSDPDGSAPSVATVDGVALTPGQSTTLASGAVVKLLADGTLTYDPAGQFNALISPLTAASTGALNTSATDSFDYTLAGGGSATVTVTVTGVDGPGDQLWGDGDSNLNVTGTPNPDYFDLSQGGDDTVFGLASNDAFFFGAAFTGDDTVDGGAGNNDQIGLEGDYTGANALVLKATTITGVELIAALPGFDYDITTVDANVPDGGLLTIYGNNLGVGDDLTVDGSLESNGEIRVFGGRGTDLLTGGSDNDGFYFGPERFSLASDRVDGGGGNNDQFALNGDYAITLDGTAIQNIEVIALLPGRIGELGDLADYDLVLANTLIDAGETMTLWGVNLETVLTIDGSLETDGRIRMFGGTLGDTLIGGDGDDWFLGGLGADQITGGDGADTFFYQGTAQSLISGFDRITGFEAADRIDLPFAVAGIAGALAGSLTSGTRAAQLEGYFGAGALGLGQAGVFSATAGDDVGRIFLVVDANGTAGYQAAGDFLIELVAPASPIDNVGLFI